MRVQERRKTLRPFVWRNAFGNSLPNQSRIVFPIQYIADPAVRMDVNNRPCCGCTAASTTLRIGLFVMSDITELGRSVYAPLVVWKTKVNQPIRSPAYGLPDVHDDPFS